MTVSPDRRPPGRELTPAAEVLVDQFTADVRQRVLDASGNAQPGAQSDEIRLDSVREVLARLTLEESANQTRRGRYRTLLAGAASVALGLVIGASSAIVKVGVNGHVIEAAIAAFSAIIAVVVSTFAWRRSADNDEHRNRVGVLFLQAISQLEFVARRTVRGMLAGEDSAIASLSDVLAALEKSKIWLASDVVEFRALLRIRNNLLHQGRPVSSDEFVKAITSASRLSRELSRSDSTTSEARTDLSSSAFDYEKAVHAAIRRVVGGGNVSDSYDSAFDYLVELPYGSMFIETKFRANRNLRISDLLPTLDSNAGSKRPGLLIVTNAKVTDSARDQLSTLDRNAALVQWRSPVDDPRLRQEIAALSQSTMAAGSAGRVEISPDADGKYRFTIKSRNGEVLATGGAYDTRAALMNALESVQSVLAELSIVDMA